MDWGLFRYIWRRANSALARASPNQRNGHVCAGVCAGVRGALTLEDLGRSSNCGPMLLLTSRTVEWIADLQQRTGGSISSNSHCAR